MIEAIETEMVTFDHLEGVTFRISRRTSPEGSTPAGWITLEAVDADENVFWTGGLAGPEETPTPASP